MKEIRYGVDFGWTNPTAIVALGYDSDGRVWVLDEVYQRQMRQEDIIQALIEFRQTYGEGEILSDPSNPETIYALRQAGLNASGYHAKREDGLREFGGRFAKAGDGQPRIFISKRCVNLTSELLEYQGRRERERSRCRRNSLCAEVRPLGRSYSSTIHSV